MRRQEKFKNQNQGKKQTKEMDQKGIQIMESSDINFKIIITNMFKWIKDKMDVFWKEPEIFKNENYRSDKMQSTQGHSGWI